MDHSFRARLQQHQLLTATVREAVDWNEPHGLEISNSLVTGGSGTTSALRIVETSFTADQAEHNWSTWPFTGPPSHTNGTH